VNYFTRELESVFKVHDSALTALSVSAGFCVTGSEDQFLRVWPLDFSEFFLEARHEGAVLAIDVSIDGLNVACGSSNGGTLYLHF
jgi:WD40 repeat protein